MVITVLYFITLGRKITSLNFPNHVPFGLFVEIQRKRLNLFVVLKHIKFHCP